MFAHAESHSRGETLIWSAWVLLFGKRISQRGKTNGTDSRAREEREEKREGERERETG